MKTKHAFFAAAAVVAVSATAEPEVMQNPDSSGWRVSVGVRTAPSVKTRATVDVPAVVGRAGRVVPFGRSSSSSSTETTPGTGTSSGSGRTREEALAASARKPDGSFEFDNGYIRPDSAAVDGETWNWHFDSASAYSGGTISGTTAFGSGDGSTTVTERRDTRTTLSEKTASGFSDSTDKEATGFDLGLSRTLWQGDGFGIDLSLGWTVYEDTDVFRMGGRAYEGRATSRTATETATTSSGSSGTVTTTVTVDPSFDVGYATMPDGSLGGASFDGMPSQPGWGTPLLIYDPASVSTTVAETGSGTGGTTTKRTAGPEKTRNRTIDVRSKGELSMQELRLGIAPWWEPTDGVRLQALLGIVDSYAEIETRTSIFVDGAEVWKRSHTDDDWKIQGYAGLSIAVSPLDWLEISAGAEVRFPNRRVRFDDGIASGSVELADWTAFAAVGIRF